MWRERYDTKVEMAKEMLMGNESVDKIVRYLGLSKETVDELRKELLQPV